MKVVLLVQYRFEIKVFGIVQGVGFRPFVYRLAQKYNLSGYVLNDGNGVEIEVEGESCSVDMFYTELKQNPPSLAKIDKIVKKEILLKNTKTFEIISSSKSCVTTSLPLDVSLCDDCLEEMRDEKNRRYNYPFINCTNCGVRYTIIKSLPYDRVNTSMSFFEMCQECSKEYVNPKNRRYHAQPISCFECGPKLSLFDGKSREYEDVVEKVVQHIKDGKCVAIKGVGGFHLVCDATNDEAIKNLREKKQRVSKPFGVMFGSLLEIKDEVEVTKVEEKYITSQQKPIVLVKKKNGSKLSDLVAPNISKVGVFLAYTPLHVVILEKLKRPLIATSANLSSEPIIVDDVLLFKKLSHVVDVALSYNREIVNPCDDSVLTIVDKKAIFYRLARGYAPLSFYTKNKTSKKILALGANQKSSITLGFDNLLVHSAYIGDLDSISTMEYFLNVIKSFEKLYGFVADVVVCDKHPNYESTKFAKSYVEKNLHVELVTVQHHYAHALSVMCEYGLKDDVLAFCFDGTGYGDDTHLWGGEILLCSIKNYNRVGHFREFALLGGEKAIKEPKRVLLSLLFDIFEKEEVFKYKFFKNYTQKELQTFYTMHSKKLNAPLSSSVGRLFDAVYALCGLDSISYEGESGLVLESFVDENIKDSYTFSVENGLIIYDEMLKEMLQETDKTKISSKFLNTLANIILEVSKSYVGLKVVLCGGVFQNTTLLNKVTKLLKDSGIEYFVQQQTALNDGSISFGQAYYVKEKYE